jgi:hypothetical protein
MRFTESGIAITRPLNLLFILYANYMQLAWSMDTDGEGHLDICGAGWTGDQDRRRCIPARLNDLVELGMNILLMQQGNMDLRNQGSR